MKTCINLEQLPEQIFGEIFMFLGCKTLYMGVRNVCKKLRQYVSCYLKIKGIFMLVGSIRNPSKVIYICQRRGSNLIERFNAKSLLDNQQPRPEWV